MRGMQRSRGPKVWIVQLAFKKTMPVVRRILLRMFSGLLEGFVFHLIFKGRISLGRFFY